MGRTLGIATVAAAAALLFSGAPPAAATDDLTTGQWGVARTGADVAHQQGHLGAGIDVAVVDSGVHLTHREFAGRIGPGLNLVAPGAPPQDDEGHGTHVAGIIGAARGDGGTVGVAPAARIMPVKALEADGSGTAEDVADGIRWAVDNGAEVINLSLASDTQFLFGPSTADAVEYAWSRGVICVFAAGNGFVLSSGFGDEPAVVVSATSRDDQKAYFSDGVGAASWGMAAPGGPAGVLDPVEDDILSTYWRAGGGDATYGYLAGTSMAAPFVSGAAAVLRGLGLSPQQTVDTLLATAHDLGAPGHDATFGAGRLDLAAAVARATGTPPPAAAPPAPDPATASAGGEVAGPPGGGGNAPAAPAGAGRGGGGTAAQEAAVGGGPASASTSSSLLSTPPASSASGSSSSRPGEAGAAAYTIELELAGGDGPGSEPGVLLPGVVAAAAAAGTGVTALRLRRRASILG